MLPRASGCDPHSFPRACTLLSILSLCRQLKTVACPGARSQMHPLGAPQITRHAKKREKRKENILIPVLNVRIFQRPFQCWHRTLWHWTGHSGSLRRQCQPCSSPQGHGAQSRVGTGPGAEQTSRNPTVRVVRGSKRLLKAHRAYELTYLKSAGLCGW